MKAVAVKNNFQITPSRRFWECDLELPIERLMTEYSDFALRQSWLKSLSGRQINVLYAVSHDTDFADDMSLSEKRNILVEESDQLFNYYLVNRFNHAKLQTAVSDIAREILDEDLLTFCLVKQNKYDKKSLLFVLFRQRPEALKNIYHYDKIHKKGFAAFVLLKPPRQREHSFAQFVLLFPIDKVLAQYDASLGDGFESKLQNLFLNDGRLYLFIRRASYEDILLNREQVLHGHRLGWTIIDFAVNGHQVNICARCPQKSAFIANTLISGYFEKKLAFIDAPEVNFRKQVERFMLHSAYCQTPTLKLFEVKFRSPCLHDDTTIVIRTCPHNAIAKDLRAMQAVVGDVLSDITVVDSIRVLYQNKRITLYFRCLGEKGDQVRICYSEHVLDRNARTSFRLWMRECYGLKILPKARDLLKNNLNN